MDSGQLFPYTPLKESDNLNLTLYRIVFNFIQYYSSHKLKEKESCFFPQDFKIFKVLNKSVLTDKYVTSHKQRASGFVFVSLFFWQETKIIILKISRIPGILGK